MKHKIENKNEHCGNCGSHNAHQYPQKSFCMHRFLQGQTPIVDTLWRCEDWHQSEQECQCIEDAEKGARKRA